MESFEGGRGNPEIKDKKKLGIGSRVRLAAAILLGVALGSNISNVSPTPKTPDEIRPPEPTVPTPPQPTATPKNI